MPHVIDITVANEFSQPGRYVVEDVNAGEWLAHGWAVRCNELPDDALKPFDASKDWNGKSVLFQRPGGFGDLLFLTPAFARLRELWPAIIIVVSCLRQFNDAPMHDPNVNEVVPYPLKLSTMERHDAHVWLEGYIESDARGRDEHPVDLLAARLGITITNKRMRYSVTDGERKWVVEHFPRVPTKTRIGVQLQASAKCRSYQNVAGIVHALYARGHEVYMFGAPGSLAMHESWNDKPGLVNLTAASLSFRESCAVLETCDALVAPDSALVHVADALSIPCLALYGPFPWQIRTKYAPHTKALTGHCDVSPCFHHCRAGAADFPANGPCARTGRCEALAAIPIERIVKEVEKML